MIDGSVLSAVGLLLMFSVIERIPDAIKAGKSVKISKGDSSVEITADTSTGSVTSDLDN